MPSSHSPRRRSRIGRRKSAYASSLPRDDSMPGKQQQTPPSSHPIPSSRRHSSFAAGGPMGNSPRTFQDGMHAPEPVSSDDSGQELHVKLERNGSCSPPLTAPVHMLDDSPLHHHCGKPMTYTSLPPSPISPSTPQSESLPSHYLQQEPIPYEYHRPPFSLWDYLREELLATDFDSHQELKWERVSNFLSVPLAIEKILTFGFIVCFDSFLYTFTILPIRFSLAVYRILANIVTRSSAILPPSQKADILRAALLVLCIMISIPLTDASKIYHFIRGQDTIKLYVIFNALEILDRLLSSLGQDVLDCLFSRTTLLLLSRHLPLTSRTFRPILFFTLATLYTVTHGLVLLYELTCLNVAINSYDHALLTLLISNQFVEIKGSVFKKFEKDNLFQITCADIVERFTLSVMLTAVAFRNMVELSGTDFDLSEGFVLPKSFGWFGSRNFFSLMWTISYPVMTVLFSEIAVDWLKHAFITKFNHIRPSVYERFTDVLCLDLASASPVGRRGARKHSYVDQSPIVARRLGFPALPLAVLVAVLGSQSVALLMAKHDRTWSELSALPLSVANIQWVTLGFLFWICFVVIKVILGVNLISYATHRQAGMEYRAEEDKINDFGRDPIGEGKEERAYNRDLKELLDNKTDDATLAAEIGENKPKPKDSSRKDDRNEKKRPKLEDLTRFTMVKRIW